LWVTEDYFGERGGKEVKKGFFLFPSLGKKGKEKKRRKTLPKKKRGKGLSNYV